MISLFVVEMSSKKKHKRLCPFSSAKKAPKWKTSKVFHKKWSEVLASSNEGSYLEQDKLLELDGLDEEQDEAGGFPFLVPAVSNLNESIATVCKRRNHKSNCRRFTIVFHLSSFVEDSENTEPCRLNGVGKTVTIFFLALCRYMADCPAEVTHALTF